MRTWWTLDRRTGPPALPGTDRARTLGAWAPPQLTSARSTRPGRRRGGRGRAGGRRVRVDGTGRPEGRSSPPRSRPSSRCRTAPTSSSSNAGTPGDAPEALWDRARRRFLGRRALIVQPPPVDADAGPRRSSGPAGGRRRPSTGCGSSAGGRPVRAAAARGAVLQRRRLHRPACTARSRRWTCGRTDGTTRSTSATPAAAGPSGCGPSCGNRWSRPDRRLWGDMHDFVVVANRSARRPGGGAGRHRPLAAQPGRPGHRAGAGHAARRMVPGSAGPARRARPPDPFDADGMHLVAGAAVRATRSRTSTRASPTPRCGRSTTT